MKSFPKTDRQRELDWLSPFAHLLSGFARSSPRTTSPQPPDLGWPSVQYPLLFLLAFALAAMQILIGGAALAYALPIYCILAVVGIGALAFPGRRECARTRLACVLSALVLAGYVGLRSWFSAMEYLARSDFFLILGCLVVYLLTAIHFSGSRQRLGIVWMLFFVALLQVVLGAVQFKRQDDWMLLPWIFRPNYWFRASGFYLNPNHLAGLLEMLGMMLLSVCIWARGPFAMRAFAAYGFLACIGGIVLTGSRSGYVATIVGTLVFIGITLAFIYHMRRREFWSLALVAGGVFAVVIVISLIFIRSSDVLSTRFEDAATSSNARMMHWPAAIKQFQLNPDFGTGAGSYMIFGRQFRDRTPAYDSAHVHNDYLELLAEYGLVGGGLMAVFLIIHFASGTFGLRRVILRKLRHGSRTKSNEMALLTGAISGAAALVVHSITDYNLHIPANALFIAFLFGIIANPTAETEESTAVLSNRWIRFVAPAVSLILLFKAWPLVSGEYLAERTRVAFRAGDYDNVVALADRALQRERANADLPYFRGEAEFRLAMESQDAAEREALFRKAIASFQEGIKMFPQDSRLWTALARSHDQLREFEPAGKAFKQAFVAEPGSADIYAAYGLHWQLQDDIPKATECFERARILRGIATPQPPKKRAPNRRPEPALPGMPVQSHPPAAPAPIVPVETRPRPATPAPGELPPGGGPVRPKPQKRPSFTPE